MRVLTSLRQAVRARRWTPIIAAAGLLAVLSGCVVYPAGDYGSREHSWHQHDRR